MKSRRALRIDPMRCKLLAGVGGIGTGIFFALEGDATLGRNESRPARLLDVRDYCKLHIISHYFSVLAGGGAAGGVRVLPIGKVGDDEAGRRLRREMEEAGMDTRFVEAAAGLPTLLSVCFQYPDGSGGNITTSEAAAAALLPADVDRAEALFAEYAPAAYALAAPEAPLEARERLLDIATRHGAFRAAAFTSSEIPEALSRGMLERVDLAALNEDEAAAVAGVEFDRSDPRPLLDACAAAMTRLNAGVRIILSAGASGAYGFEDGRWRLSPAAKVPVASTAGAGDALLGATLAGLAAGMPFTAEGAARPGAAGAVARGALDFGVLAASLSVTSPHTIHPDMDLDAVERFARDVGVEPTGVPALE